MQYFGELCLHITSFLEDSTWHLIPAEQAIIAGEKVRFTCVSDSPVKWKLNNGLLPEDVKIKHKDGTNRYKILVSKAQLYHGGKYSCEGYSRKYKETFTAIGVLSVKRKVPGSKHYYRHSNR